MKPTTLRRSSRATCSTCAKTWDARNAQAVGHDHHQRTGHRVEVEVTHTYAYAARDKRQPVAPLFGRRR